MASVPKISFTIRPPTSLSRAGSSGGESDDPPFKIPRLPRRLVNESTPGSPLARSTNSSPRPRRLRHEERDSSDEDDDGVTDELVTGFDQFGVQRCVAIRNSKVHIF
jgi:hypothetical protein